MAILAIPSSFRAYPRPHAESFQIGADGLGYAIAMATMSLNRRDA